MNRVSCCALLRVRTPGREPPVPTVGDPPEGTVCLGRQGGLGVGVGTPTLV